MREVTDLVLVCPVCRVARLLVSFRMPGTDLGDPAELVEVDAAGRVACECYESDMVDRAKYDADLLRRAVSTESLCGPGGTGHRPTMTYRCSRTPLTNGATP